MNDKNTNILLVEDEPGHAELIRRSFKSASEPVSLTVARNLHEARSSIAKSTPDLIIADFLLPDGKGIELIPDKKKDSPYPVIILTSYGDELVAVEAMKAGAFDYIVKSEVAMDNMSRTCKRILREWSHITKLKRLEETLLQSEKLKALGIITAGVAHEFNNILAVMMGSAEVLEGGFKDDKELKRRLHAIIKAGDDGAKVVRNMLTFAKSEANPSEYICSDIRLLIEEAISFAEPKWRNIAQAKGIDYKIDKEGMKEIPETFCLPTEIREVFTNIINNALNAMPDGGSLSFSTWSDDDTVFISISDTGKGMSEDVKKRIFDPFFTTRRPEGTGLGMSVSYGVIAGHGGEIEVESEEGQGTTLNLSIPIKREIAQQKPSSKPETHEIMAKELRILFVDDSEEMCVIMNNALTRGGHTVKVLNSGAEAVELAGKEDFDLILSDLAMPDVNGYEVVKMLNKLDRRPKIGIITGWRETLELFDEEETKVDFIIKKPFKHSVLIKHINAAFAVDSKLKR